MRVQSWAIILPPFIPYARAVVRAFSFGEIAVEALRALSRRKLTFACGMERKEFFLVVSLRGL